MTTLSDFSTLSNRRVGEIAAATPVTIRVFQRHGIDFCCGGKLPLAEACAKHGVALVQVEREIAQALAPSADERDWSRVPLRDLTSHIFTRYHDGLRAEMPRLEQMAAKVDERHGERYPDQFPEVPALLQRLWREFLPHLREEESAIFPLIERLDEEPGAGDAALTERIGALEADHQSSGEVLARLRVVTHDFTPPEGACNTFRGLYAGLAELEREVQMHVHLENNVLFPRAAQRLAMANAPA